MLCIATALTAPASGEGPGRPPGVEASNAAPQGLLAARRSAKGKGAASAHTFGSVAEAADQQPMGRPQLGKQRSLFWTRVEFAASLPVQAALWFCVCGSAWLFGVVVPVKRPRVAEGSPPACITIELLDAAATSAAAYWRDVVRKDTGHRCYAAVQCECLGVVRRNAAPDRAPRDITPSSDFATFRWRLATPTFQREDVVRVRCDRAADPLCIVRLPQGWKEEMQCQNIQVP